MCQCVNGVNGAYAWNNKVMNKDVRYSRVIMQWCMDRDTRIYGHWDNNVYEYMCTESVTMWGTDVW